MNDDRPNPHGLGARIRSARRAHGLTQEQLARAVGVTRSAVAQWETDRAGQIGGNLTRVARALGTTTEYLLTGQELPGAAPLPTQADEMGLLRAYRACSPQDRALLLRTALRLARAAESETTSREASPDPTPD
jgi:transcriptional regulator with XRE-family HTH domain